MTLIILLFCACFAGTILASCKVASNADKFTHRTHQDRTRNRLE